MKTFCKFFFLVVLLFCSLQSGYASFGEIFDTNQPESPYCNDDDQCGLKQGINAVEGIDGFETERNFSDYIQDIVKYLLLFVNVIAVILIIYAGFYLITSVGDEDKVKKSKMMIVYVLLGIVIIFLASPIANFFLNVLNTNSGG